MHSQKESGFTLVELLVVILIIGILAAVAIPVFLNQRKTANDAAVQSDVKNMALSIETYFVNNKDATIIDLDEIKKMMSKSNGVLLTVHGDRNDFCITGKHYNGKKYAVGLVQSENNHKRPYVLYANKGEGFIQEESYVLTGRPCHFNNLTWS